ncbi:DsbA family oxidoreductase [Streptomyces sp. GC420]|uniref:DsbA family oxidoreductase n=1 Tax=Streptomyces sp. GC420 TaxID=2697568 RepID=UPI0014152F2C|nr:DsbA family oxidoreductase [Streptomyces sp. GC420]NBM18092.1 DsbA family oxidoreductase [Streptomyces sp. GC420]
MRVEIWSDIACPWCYIGKARFEKGLAAFPHRDEVEVVHRSFELDPRSPKGVTGPVIPMLAKKYGLTEAQARQAEENVAGHARAEGLDYVVGRDHGNTFDLHRLLHLARARGRHEELLTLFYRANFAEEESVHDPGRQVALAVAAGLDETEVRAVLADPGAYADEVRGDEAEAARLGANGVPFFVIDRRYGLSGAQPADVFARALERAWADREPEPAGDAAACGPDGSCEAPRTGNVQAGAHS